MLKKAKLTYRGMNQDLSKSKRAPGFYFDAENVRLLATDIGSVGSLTNDRGNTLVFSLEAGQIIIGHAVLKDYLVLFSTNNNTDKITRVAFDGYVPFELFSGNLNFSKDHLIQTEVYYESDDKQKVYWVDGVNQLRHINIISVKYSQAESTLFDAVPEVTFSSPYVSSIDYGGIHTSGMIQYAYNLIRQNGSQSAIGPMSELYPLNKAKTGAKVNEYVGKILNVTIDSIDPKYDIIRLYAIKYTSYNEQPSINLIAEESIGGNQSFSYSDDGRTIRAISSDQLNFLGGIAYIPSTLTSKYNRLILGDIEELYFDIDTAEYDTRAYSFPLNSETTKIKNSGDISYSTITYDGEKIYDATTLALIADDHDCITPSGESETVEEITSGDELYYAESTLAVTQDDFIYHYIPIEGIPTTENNLHVTISLNVTGQAQINRDYVFSGTDGLNCAQVISDYLSGPEFEVPLHSVLSQTGVVYDYIGEAASPFSIISEVTLNSTGEHVDHFFTVSVTGSTSSSSITLETPGLYQYNSSIRGATGTNISLEIVQKDLTNPRNILKSNEIYRIGIEFFNRRGQNTSPKWITDLRIPSGNLNGDYNTLKVTLSNTEILQSLGVIGWRVLRVDRTEQDKTILCQGMVSTMIFQNYQDVRGIDMSKGVQFANTDLLKVPSPFIRNTTDLKETWKRKPADASEPFIHKLQHGVCISEEATTGEIDDPRNEIFRDSESGSDNSNNNRQLSFEETRLLQLFSPEITFGNVNLSENLKLRLNHSAVNTIQASSEWAKQYNTDNNLLAGEFKRNAKLSLFQDSYGIVNAINQYARIGGTGDHNIKNSYQYYRNYTFGDYVDNAVYDILDTPIDAGLGQNGLKYDNSGKYNFTNSLGTIMADKNHQDGGDDGIISVNSLANKNISVVLSNEQTLESIFSFNSVAANSNGVFELTRTLSNQYGGNTYEARSRNSYLRIGKYNPLSSIDNFTQIDQAGDTFVGQFRFARILGNTTSVQSSKYYEMTEIVEFPVETSIDINNRSDYSTSWDSVFMPTFDEYHNYNKVYSQQPVFNRTTATPFTFQERKVFDNRINATKVKVSGEIVDSWTDILVNEELYVDGKFGPIVKIIQNNDLTYCFQEQAISMLEISPRVQTVATDGSTVELGRGSVLYNYRYINTNSGSVNPESIFKSQSSVYYIDVINKSINRITGGELVGLSDIHGLHTFVYETLDYNTLKYSNLVNGCFDQISNDAYFTTPQFTLAFNELTNSFTSRYSFKPAMYIYSAFGLLSSNTGNKLWQHNIGNYGSYYGVTYDSSITFTAAPEPDIDCIFNNGEFKSEVYNTSGNAVHNKTLTGIYCWNEHQASSALPLTVGGNIKRKFWNWSFFIPRDAVNKLQRMRGQWLNMKFTFNNSQNEKLILHDMVIGYDAITKI